MMKKNTSPPSLQDVKYTMETYACIFSETFKMMNIFLVLPISIALMKRSFSHLKMMKTSYESPIRL